MLLCRGYYTHYLHLLAIALACVLSIHHGHCFTLPVPKIDLSDKSYVLDMYLMFGDKFSYQAEEMHSAWQKRSKVYLRRYQKDKFDHNDSRLAATIHADSERLLLIDNLFVDPSCKRTDHDEVDELLKQTMLKGFDSGHLIGASRLMSFISANSEKFSQLSLSPEQQKDRVYKLIYEAKFNQNAANAFSIILFYHEEASQNFPNGVPRMISVTTSSGPLTTYMMVRYQPLKTGQVQGSTSSVESVDQYRYSQADEVTLDLFAVDRTLDCSKAILDEKDQSSHEQDDNALLASNSLRFSLHIRPVTAGSKEPQDLTAVYEPSLQNLRTEQHTKSRSFIKIMDFYDNHQYEIIRRHTLAGNSMLDRVFEPDQVDSCVVSKLNIYASNGTPYSLGQMLLGTNRLAYLGLARVRGIDTRVYQYHDCDFPIWWQHPVIYLDSSDQKNKIPFPLPKLRRERETMKKNAISITSVFYFTKPEGSSGKEEDLSKAKLLYIELLFRNDRTGAIISKTSSSVFDFDWGLPSSSPTGGGRYEDLFSLQNDCLADVDSGEYATIDLMLEAKLEQEQLDWLKDRTKRNLALLEALQLNLFINPISMLYDFESRLITGDAITIQGSREPLHPVSLEITTRTAARNDKVANLIYLGMTNVGDNFVEDTEWFVNFQLCQALVAHQKVNLMFAYRSNTGECLMFKSDILSAYDRDFDRLTEAIKVNDRASSGSEPKLDELYIIKHLNKAPYKIDRLKAASFDLKRSDNMLIYDPTRPYVSQSGSNATSRIKLDIKQVHVDRLDDEDNYELDELHLSGTNKFLGFGLVAEDEQNKLVEIRGTEDDGQTEEMSFEHCQTACLADLECRSFSVCHRQGETSCVLSSVSFSAPSIALQIMILADVEAKFGTKFSISVDQDEQEILKGINSTTKETTDSTSTSSSGSETIQLMKHGACELHNKLYRDLFKKFNLRLSRLSRRVIYPVAHVEQCSEICFMKTLNFLRETKSMFTTENAAPIDASKACDRFYYVDHETLALLEPERVEVFKKRLDLSTVHTETVGGYCVLDDSGGGDTTDYDSESLRHDDELFGQLESQRYEFDYLNLYSKQFGVSMLESPLSKKAKQALWESVKGFDAKNVADDEIPKPNENYGQQMYFNQDHGEHTSECAQECFWPFYRRAYPACRSFDSFVVINPKETTRKVCGFNSMTLASANAAHRSDLIRIGSDKQERISVRPMDTVRVWHYELRPGLVADSVEAMYKIQLAQDVKAAKAASAQVHIGGFNLFCCFVILMSLGVTIGITLNSRYLANNQKLHGDTSQLVVDDDRMDAAELAKVESGTVQQSNGQQEAASR